MNYRTESFDKRIKENIRHYHLRHLYDMELLTGYLKNVASLTGVEVLLTDRHGEKEIAIGSFADTIPDVVNNPGEKIKIQNRTMAHVYIKSEHNVSDAAHTMVKSTVLLLSSLGEETYLRKESCSYMEELEQQLKERQKNSEYREKEDVLTGTLTKEYLKNRMQIIDRSEILPVAVIVGNINDWKFVHDHYGEEESDRLIEVVAGIVKAEAREDYVIGRWDGDVFVMIIPLSEKNEVEDYVKRIKQQCLAFSDTRLAPSIAVGIQYKTNIEETLEEKVSDAEYEMFADKFEMKNAPGYRERLHRGLSAS